MKYENEVPREGRHVVSCLGWLYKLCPGQWELTTFQPISTDTHMSVPAPHSPPIPQPPDSQFLSLTATEDASNHVDKPHKMAQCPAPLVYERCVFLCLE